MVQIRTTAIFCEGHEVAKSRSKQMERITLNDNEGISRTKSNSDSSTTTAIEELQQLHKTDPDAERVNLRGRHLSQEDAEAVFSFLHDHFPKLRHLDLRDNNLHQLPQDFGTRLPKLVALNLLNNNFRFRWGALRNLGEILQHCPCLKSLSLSLSSYAEEQVLLSMLPRLRILNGIPLPFTGLGGEGELASPTIQELQQFCVSPLAKVSSTLPSTTAQQENLASNTAVEKKSSADDVKLKCDELRWSTKNSERPTDLPASISDDRTDWCKLLKVKRSQVLNAGGGPDVSTLASDSVSKSSIVVSTDAFLQQLKAVVKAFHECDLLGKASSASKTKLSAQLDRHVVLLAEQLKRQERSDGGTELSEAMLQTRWSLLEVCAILGSQKAAQVNAELGSGFSMLLALQKQHLSVMQEQQCRTQLKHQDQPSAAESLASSHNQNQLKLLLDVAEGLESDLEAVQLQLQQETARREMVEQENMKLKRVRSSEASKAKSDIIRPMPAQSQQDIETLSTATQRSRQLRQSTSKQAKDSNAATNSSEVVRGPEMPALSSKLVILPPPASPRAVTVRNLSLKQLVDLVNCVYASKAKYDIRAGAPRETMEQHMYTYLNTRFGLPKLIVEYASAIWKAAEYFAPRENDAAVYVALLRNRLDEGFLGIKRKLQSALVELLKVYFSAKYPNKTSKAIAALVQSRLDGILYDNEWRNVITYLYEPQDSATLLSLVQQRAEEYQATLAQDTTKSQATDKLNLSLRFVDFEQVLYGYQLQGRLDLLALFHKAFQELDTDNVGVINQSQFVALARRIAPMKSESALTTLLESLDPFHHDVITFSDAANAFLPDIRRANATSTANSMSQTSGKKLGKQAGDRVIDKVTRHRC